MARTPSTMYIKRFQRMEALVDVDVTYTVSRRKFANLIKKGMTEQQALEKLIDDDSADWLESGSTVLEVTKVHYTSVDVDV